MYTVDVHLDNIVDKKVGKDRFDNAHLSLAIRKKRRVLDRLRRNKFREAIAAGTENPCDLFDTDKELFAMREFFTRVHTIYSFYLLLQYQLNSVLIQIIQRNSTRNGRRDSDSI